MYLLYSFLLSLGALVSLPYWILRGLRERKYLRSLWQRIGLRLPPETKGPKPIWIHAVSVGEVLAAKPLVQALRRARPDIPLVASTITWTGQGLAQKELAACSSLFYFPFDWRLSIRPFLRVVRPLAVVLMETELWPNFLRECHRNGVPVFLANGRISDRSFPRYLRIRSLMAKLFAQIRDIGVQTHEDRRRLLALGANVERIHVTGNLKFDYPPPEIKGHEVLLDLVRARLDIQGETPVIVAGSSMKGEEPILLRAYAAVCERIPEARLILAPRHPERFDEVADLMARASLPFVRRSRFNQEGKDSTSRVLLLDTIGELRVIYTLASVAIVGGSFLPFGGHNLLEPAACGKAIIIGPEMFNFKEMARLFLREHAARQVDGDSLAAALVELLENTKSRNLLGQRALATFRQNQGATHNTLDFLLKAVQ